MRPDAITLLRDLRPDPPPPAPDEAVLERIVATPPQRPARRRRRRVLRPALALATAAVAAALVVAPPGGSPDVLARAAQALDNENAILYFRTETRHRGNDADLTRREPDAVIDSHSEGWQADEGRRSRHIFDGDGEVVRDWDARVMAAYHPDRNQIVRYTGSRAFGPESEAPRSIGLPSLLPGQVIDDLRALLERARRGEENFRLVGETTVRGIDVYELRIDFDDLDLFIPEGRDHGVPDQPSVPVEAWRTIYIDRDRFLPVRVVERSEWPARGGEIVHSITDYPEIERLPRTPENEKLLEMSHHPGAEVVERGD